jgi:alkanesulfonate monooxygenase SsuD/methylene tetrahydromethanopterin reductase-like flavin-dependent oxidoreductase (luciferase family)
MGAADVVTHDTDGRIGIAVQLTDVVRTRVVDGRAYEASVGDAAAVVELARRLDPHVSRLWLTDNLGYRSTPVLLGAVAAATRSLGLGTFTTYPYGRTPLDVAAGAATVDEILGDRELVLGISRGSRAVTNLHGAERPLRLLREYVGALKALLAGEAVEVDAVPDVARSCGLQAGQRLRLEVDPADVPVVVASTGPRTLRLAGAVADGVQFVTQQPTQSASLLADARFAELSGLAGADEAREAAGRSSGFRRIYGISVSVAPDTDDAVNFARRQVAGVLATKRDEQLAAVGIDPGIAGRVRAAVDGGAGLTEASRHVPGDVVRRLVATGSPAEVAEQVATSIERSRKWGFDEHFVCFPLGPDLKGAVDTIVGDVLPALR